jgi:hypothetical protein
LTPTLTAFAAASLADTLDNQAVAAYSKAMLAGDLVSQLRQLLGLKFK